MGRPAKLTKEQMTVIDAHMELFPAEIKKMPEFVNDDTIKTGVIRNYQKRHRVEVEPDYKTELARVLQQYMSVHGLPSRYHGKNNVTGFLEYLKQ